MKKILNAFLIFLVVAVAPLSGSGTQKAERKDPVVILGGGIGALTSAIYLQRAGIQTTVIEGPTPGGAITQSPGVHNWPGEVEIDGFELAEKVRNQAIANGANILEEEVISVDFTQRPLKVTTRELRNKEKTHTFSADAAIIALGSSPKLLGIPGESGKNGYWTKGVYSCAVCDGALYKDKTVAVVGGGDSAIIEADYLSKIAKKVYVILRSDQFKTVETVRKNELVNRPNVEVIYNTKIGEIQGDGTKVSHLKLSTDKQLPVDGVFIAIGADPNTSFFINQISLDQTNHVKLMKGQQTSVPGVFAIGDVADPYYKQAVSAAGDGAKAALEVENYLASMPKQKSAPAIPQVKKVNNGSGKTVEEISTTDDFYSAIGKNSAPIVVDFYSPYCGPCRRLSPEFDKIAAQYQGKIRFAKVNAAEFSDLASAYNIHGVPTVLVFDKNGEQIHRGTGLDEIRAIFKKLDNL